VNTDYKFILTVVAVLAVMCGSYMLTEKYNNHFYKKYGSRGWSRVWAAVTAVAEFFAWFFHFQGGVLYSAFVGVTLVCIVLSLFIGAVRAKDAGATPVDVLLAALCQAIASLGVLPAMIVLIDLKPHMRRPER